MTTSLLTNVFFLTAIIILAVFDAVLKGFSLWKSARKNQMGWFICLIVFNTCGILPIIYLLLNRNKKS
jgi:hypothetical protein